MDGGYPYDLRTPPINEAQFLMVTCEQLDLTTGLVTTGRDFHGNPSWGRGVKAMMSEMRGYADAASFSALGAAGEP